MCNDISFTGSSSGPPKADADECDAPPAIWEDAASKLAR